MINKRNSFGSAEHWLSGHTLTLSRYLNVFYPTYDWPLIKRFFWQNPIQAKVILSDFKKSNDLKFKEITDLFIMGKSKLVYIVGARGSGKTATAFYFAEHIHNQTGRPIFYIAPSVDKTILPSWMKFTDNIDNAPKGCLAMVDETAIQFNAREFANKEHRDLTKLLVIARHKDMSIIFLTQHQALSDVNLTRLRDIVIWKLSNDYQISEQSGGRQKKENKFWQKVRNMMAPRSKEDCLFEFPSMRRFIYFKHPLPDCWTEALSKSWQDSKFTKKKEDEAIKPKILKKKEVLYI